MEIFLFILLALLIAGAIWLVPIALSIHYMFRGKLGNDDFMIRLRNGNFVDITLNSRTGAFQGGSDPVKRWEITDSKKDDSEVEVNSTFNIGFWPVDTAQRVFIPINSIDVIRPQEKGDKITYKLTPTTIVCRNPPRFLVHGFETTPVETKGGSGKIGDSKVSDDTDLVALLTEILQVEIEIFNPYLAFVRIPTSKPGQSFMNHINGTLQSVAREVTAQFTYNEIIKAKVEDDPVDDSTSRSEEEKAELKKRFGNMFKRLADASLAAYGVRIKDVNLLDHSLEPGMQEALQAPQKAYYRAQETVTNAQASKRKKELEAEGDAAELAEIMKAVNNNQNLALAEIHRRGLQRAAEGVGKSFSGDFLTVNFGGSGTQQGVTPAVNVKPKEDRHEKRREPNKHRSS